jgi:hypothetical protein
MKAYEEKKVTVTVQGTGNLVTMTRPSFERDVPGLKIISEEGASAFKVRGGTLEGNRKFTYTLCPEKAGAMNPGRLRFSFFNPESRSYETAGTEEISFTVTGDGGGSRHSFDDEKKKEGIDFNPFYIMLIVLGVAGSITLVFFWERKRLRLAAGDAGLHGDESAAQKAPDERDHLGEASQYAERGDADGFLRAAEKALDRMARGGTRSPGEAAARIREEIYGYKFGRGSMSPDDMQRLRGEIEGLIKN